jgi:hypothetical protein
MGEQPHPWPLLQDQDGKSRHRNLIRNFFRDQTMSSPPRTPFRADGGGRRMMVELSESLSFFRCHDTSDVPRRATTRAISLRRRYSARSVVTGSYGLIDPPTFDGQKPQLPWNRPSPMAGRPLVRCARCIRQLSSACAAGRCSVHSNLCLSLSFHG